MKLMQYDRIPRKYNLSWDRRRKSINIDIHKDCVESFKVENDAPIVTHLRESCDANGLGDTFHGDLKSDFFGINGAVIRDQKSGDYTTFVTPLPQICKMTHLTCKDCRGSGKRSEDKTECLYCEGSGRKRIFDWRSGYITAGSLSILFETLDRCPESSARDSQHASINLIAQRVDCVSYIGGTFGVDFSDYLRLNEAETRTIILPNALTAMGAAYGQLFMITNDYNVRGSVSGGLTLSCPTGACGIHMQRRFQNKVGRGSEFTCYDVETPQQSLTLLAGIASFVGQVEFYLSAQRRKRSSVPT